MRSAIALTLLIMLQSGCIRTAVVQFWAPAQLDVSSLDRIMVAGFSGDQGDSLADNLSRQLWASDFYTIVPPSESEKELKQVSHVQPSEREKIQQSPEQQKVQQSPEHQRIQALLGNARAEGVDGVVLGNVVEYRCEDKPVRKSPFRLAGESVSQRPAVVAPELRDNTVRQATVTVEFKLVDVESGEIRADRQVSHHFEAMVERGDQIPTQTEILEQLARQCVDDIVAMLAPHEVDSEIKLAACEMWTRGRREVRSGMLLAQEGEWDQAEEMFRQALDKEPDNHAALFNLAIVADHRQDYEQAENFAMRALRLQHKSCYTAGLETIRAHRSAADKASRQRDAQISQIFGNTWE